jgi:hypothetical protein
MLIREAVWSKIRAQFTEAEKAALRRQVTGETMCPRGLLLDAQKLDPKLAQKLAAALGEVQP